MKPSEFKISLPVKIYDEKTADNYRNCYVAEKQIVFELSNIPICDILISQIRDFNGVFVRISCVYLVYFPINRPSKSVTVGPVHRFK